MIIEVLMDCWADILGVDTTTVARGAGIDALHSYMEVITSNAYAAALWTRTTSLSPSAGDEDVGGEPENHGDG